MIIGKIRRALVAAAIVAALPVVAAAGPGSGPARDAAEPRGSLFIIGGGDWPPSFPRLFVDLASKSGTGRIVVFTMASGVPEESGPELVKDFRGAGAADVTRYHLGREEAERPETAAILDGAGGVFFSGGDQSRVTAAIGGTPVHERLKSLYREGAVIGGTSAGAAIMSEIMITGDEKRKPVEGKEWSTIEAGNVVTAPGLGFLAWGIVDQHFIARRRQNRLLSLVAEHPALLGVGIDESTAILVSPGRTFRVLGAGQVIVYDAARADVRAGGTGPVEFRGVVMHLLRDGDVFDLAKRSPTREPAR